MDGNILLSTILPHALLSEYYNEWGQFMADVVTTETTDWEKTITSSTPETTTLYTFKKQIIFKIYLFRMFVIIPPPPQFSILVNLIEQ